MLTGTPLFVLPDGHFFLLVNHQFVQLTADRVLALASNQTDIVWESHDTTNAGVTQNVPAFNATLGAGTFFSAMSTVGSSPFPLTLL